jgi:hypothetical protein
VEGIYEAYKYHKTESSRAGASQGSSDSSKNKNVKSKHKTFRKRHRSSSPDEAVAGNPAVA